MKESVLVRVARGDSEAVRECIDEFGGLIWAIARRMTRSRADAEDAVQEIFVDIWRSAGRFDAAQGSEKVTEPWSDSGKRQPRQLSPDRGLRRADGAVCTPGEALRVQGGDTLVLSGTPESLALAEERLMR